MASSSWITPSGVNNTGSSLTFPQGTQITETALGTLAMVSSAATNQLQIPNGAGPEYGSIGWVSNVWSGGTTTNGGVVRSTQHFSAGTINFAPNAGGNAWQISTAGHLLCSTDNAVDIGQSGANRPRNFFSGTRTTTPAYTVGSTAGADFGPAGVVSLTVVKGIITAAS